MLMPSYMEFLIIFYIVFNLFKILQHALYFEGEDTTMSCLYLRNCIGYRFRSESNSKLIS